MTAVAYEQTSPLAAMLRRINALDSSFTAQVIDELGHGWFRASQLAADPALLEAALQQVVAPYSVEDQQRAAADRHIAAAFLIHAYAWWLPAAAIACYLTERRVPDLDPHNMSLRLPQTKENTGHGFEIAFLSQRIAVLPDDPAADDPSTLVLADTLALRDWFRSQLEAHLTPLIEAVYRATGFGRRAQWNLVADDCAALFLWIGQRLGAEAQSCAEGLAFIRAEQSPMRASKTDYFTLEYGGRCATFRKRGGCCLYYKLSAQTNCSTCALISEEQRVERLMASMVKEAA